MLNVALTGNIAAGKSAVAELFRRWGAAVIDADELARAAQAPGTPVLAAIAARFGAGVLRPDGSLDRAALRGIVMADPAALADLNRLVHPDVLRRRAEAVAAARAGGAQVAVSVIPLLFEAADPAAFDVVVLVDAPEAVRHARLTRDRGLAAEEASRMIGAQLPAGPKRERSDFVIENSGDRTALERRAAEVWAALVARAERAERA